MTTLFSKLTGTRNVLVNSVVAIAVTFILVSCVALLSNIVVNPELVNSASFGYIE